MRKEKISQVMNEIDSSYLTEAMEYKEKKRRVVFGGPWGKMLVAAALCLCFLISFKLLKKEESAKVMAFTYKTNKELSEIDTVLSTGQLNGDGSMTGSPLSFVLKGDEIKCVRFSVKNQWLDFHDCTEKRDEYGLAKNFTVDYGKNVDDYEYLLIEWNPDDIWNYLNEGTKVTELPQELREDVIVMEITLVNGKSMTMAVKIRLRDDGKFVATFVEYTIQDTDTFVKRADDKPIGLEPGENPRRSQEEENEENMKKLASLSKEEKNKAKKAAEAYYKKTVMKVVSIEPFSYDGTNLLFDVCVKIDGKIQNPNRTIIMQCKDGKWIVENEGY